MGKNRKIIRIDEELCDGCGQCVTSCAEGAIAVIDGKARIVKDSYCDGLGACIGECPQGALEIIEREADEFDPEAVEQYLESKEKESAHKPEGGMPCGCPSANIMTFAPTCESANRPVSHQSGGSALTHWPVQVRLVPANAPFLKGADLLIAADCAPVAYPDLHRDFLPGKVVLLGCPKFDNAGEYLKKFRDIFETAGIRSVTVLSMEVPCCSALPAMVRKALLESGKKIPVEEVVIGTQGAVLSRKNLAA